MTPIDLGVKGQGQGGIMCCSTFLVIMYSKAVDDYLTFVNPLPPVQTAQNLLAGLVLHS